MGICVRVLIFPIYSLDKVKYGDGECFWENSRHSYFSTNLGFFGWL